MSTWESSEEARRLKRRADAGDAVAALELHQLRRQNERRGAPRTGRPRKPVEEKLVQIGVYVTPAKKKDWEARAAAAGCTVSAWVVSVIDKAPSAGGKRGRHPPP